MSKIICVIAAHADDEVLGCGGSISKFVEEGSFVHVLILADGESSRDGLEKTEIKKAINLRNKAARSANDVLGVSSLTMLNFPDNKMDSVDLLDVVKKVESFLVDLKPAMVITHNRSDVNIDHQICHQAVVVACRPQPGHSVRELLFMEVASSTEWAPYSNGGNYSPNYWVDITQTIEKKLSSLESYREELREFPHPRSLKGVSSLSSWRGATIGVPFAESFMAGRIIR